MTRKFSRGLSVVLVAMIGAVGAAPAGAATAPRSFYGMSAWKVPTETGFKRMKEAKVGVYRFGIFWKDIESSRGKFNFAFSDAHVLRAAKNGIEPLAILHQKPAFFGDDYRRVPKNAEELAAFGRFVTAATRRYGPNGTFFRAKSRKRFKRFAVRKWQIWNEVNGARADCPPTQTKGCEPHGTAGEYKKVVTVAAKIIRRADRGAKIGLAGIAETKRAVSVESYLKQLYKQRSFARNFDAIGLHPYARTPKEALAAVKNVRGFARKGGDPGVAIWLTEIGWGTGGKAYNTESPKGQASKLTQSYKLFAANRKKLGIALVVWFCWQDRPLVPDEVANVAFPYAGLFKINGSPKPAFKAYAKVAGGRARGKIGPYGP